MSNDVLEKRFHEQLVELHDSINILSESLLQINKGKRYFFRVLTGQLRSLLFEKSGKLTPLLLRLIKRIKIELYANLLDLEHELITKDSTFIFPPKVSFEKNDLINEKKSLNEIIDHPFGVIKGVKVTIRDLVIFYANNEGGAHYSDKYHLKNKKNVAILSLMMTEFYVNNVQAFKATLEQIIIDLSELIIEIGEIIVRDAVSFSKYFMICIGKNETSQSQTILNGHIKNSSVKIELKLTADNNIEFIAVDFYGYYVKKEIPFSKYISSLSLINISLDYNDLESHIFLNINNEVFSINTGRLFLLERVVDHYTYEINSKDNTQTVVKGLFKSGIYTGRNGLKHHKKWINRINNCSIRTDVYQISDGEVPNLEPNSRGFNVINPEENIIPIQSLFNA